MMSNKAKTPHSHSLLVRIFATVLAVLVTGGALTYLVWFILSLIH